MHFKRRIFRNLAFFCVFSLLLFSFQNCGSGLMAQSSSSEKQNSLTDPIPLPLPEVIPPPQGQVLTLKSFGGFSYSRGVCGIDFSDRLVCWGKTSAQPAAIPGVTNIVDFVSSANQSCVLDKIGKVFCWGWQDPAIVEVPGFGKVVQLTAGNMMICALNDQAQVNCTGYPVGSTPFELVGLRGSKKISGGINVVCGITATDGVNCDVRSGSTGTWTVSQISGLSNIVDLKAGGGFPVQNCALDTAGLLKCFTTAAPGSTDIFSAPAAIPGLGPVKTFAVGGGDGGVCALQTDDRVMCFGPNDHFQINNSQTLSYASATQVLARKVLQIHRTQSGVTCILNTDHSVQCWGTPSVELGFDQVHIFSDLFTFPIASDVKQMEFFIEYYVPDVFLLKNNGDVVCRGSSRHYATFAAGETCSVSGDNFVAFHNMQNVKQISANRNQRMCALFNTGNVTCWGDIDPGSRVASVDTDLGILPELQNITQISLGSGGTFCAVSAAGKVYCSIMSYGSPNTYSRPAEVTGLANVKQLAVGYHDFCVLTTDSNVTCRNSSADTIDLSVSVQVGVSNVDQIYSEPGWGYYCAVKKDGSVVCWNNYDDAARSIVAYAPNVLSGFTDVKKLFMAQKAYVEGQDTTAQICSLDGAKKVKCVGGNDAGQISTSGFTTAENIFLGNTFVCAQNVAGTSCHGFKPYRDQSDLIGQALRW